MKEDAKEQLEKLTDLIESYMLNWSRKDSYNDFRMLLSIYMALCGTVKREPEEVLSLEHKLEEWINKQRSRDLLFK